MSRNLGKNALLSGVSWIVPAIAAFVAVPITVRGLGDNGYGVVALVAAVAGYLALMHSGLPNGILRYVSVFVAAGNGRATRECTRFVLTWFIATGAIGTALVWGLAPWLAGTLLNVERSLVPQSVLAFRIGGIAFALTAVVSALSLLTQAFLRYDLVALLNGTLVSSSFAGPAVLVELGYGLIPVMWFSVVIGVVACIAWSIAYARLMAAVPDEGPPFAQFRRSFIAFCLTNALGSASTVVQTQTSSVVVGIAGGTAQVAYFKVPSVISSKVNELLNQMCTVLLPTAAQMVADGEHGLVLALYERSSRLFYVLNASVAGAVVVFSAPLLAHWVGPQYAQQGALALAFLTLGQAVSATTMAAGNVNLALDRPRVNLAFSVANSVINLATVYSLTVAYGITGTALSGLVASGVGPLFLHYTHHAVLGTSTWRVFRDCYLRTSLAVTAVATVSWFVLKPYAADLPFTLGLVAIVAAVGMLASAASGAVTVADLESLKAVLLRRSQNRGASQ